MRIGIMTFLHNGNYGSLLQAWALQQSLAGLGAEAVHLDYSPSAGEKLRNLVRSGNSPALILEGVRKRKVRSAHETAKRKQEALASFRREKMILTGPLTDHQMLSREALKQDVLLAGSDQVWSPEWLNGAYYLDFAAKGQRKTAYAASLGVSRLENSRKASMIRRWLEGFDAVSVREEAGADLIEQISGKRPAVMPDPVLLIPEAEWKRFAEMPETHAPYLLTYFIGENPEYWREAARLAAQKGLRTVVIPVTEEAYSQEGRFDISSSVRPEEWVGLFAGASYVVTDSFHGTAFACRLGVPFTVLRRYRDGSPQSKNSRIEQLLQMTNLPEKDAVPDSRSAARLDAIRQLGLNWLASEVLRAPRT